MKLIAQCLATLFRKSCTEYGPYSNRYYNYSQGNAFLWIKYSDGTSLASIAACNFTSASKQLVTYQQQACLCPGVGGDGRYTITYDQVIVYAYNVSAPALECAENAYSGKCENDQAKDAKIALIIFAVIGGLAVLGFICVCYYTLSGRSERRLSPPQEEQDTLLPSSIALSHRLLSPSNSRTPTPQAQSPIATL